MRQLFCLIQAERYINMIKTRRILLFTLTLIFTGLEIATFYHIHFKPIDIGFSLHYGSIILAAAFAWLTLLVDLITMGVKAIFNIRGGNLIRIAMLFTLVADYFLVLSDPTPENRLYGVIIFLGTQFSVFLHIAINDCSKKALAVQIIARVLISVLTVSITLAVLGDEVNTLAIISVIYYANLIANVIFAHRSGRGGIVLTVGLILFALCDINVGLSVLNNLYSGGFAEGSLLYNLLYCKYDLVWIFYLPSQTIIPLTLLLCNKKNKKRQEISCPFLFNKSTQHYNAVLIENGRLAGSKFLR